MQKCLMKCILINLLEGLPFICQANKHCMYTHKIFIWLYQDSVSWFYVKWMWCVCMCMRMVFVHESIENGSVSMIDSVNRYKQWHLHFLYSKFVISKMSIPLLNPIHRWMFVVFELSVIRLLSFFDPKYIWNVHFRIQCAIYASHFKQILNNKTTINDAWSTFKFGPIRNDCAIIRSDTNYFFSLLLLINGNIEHSIKVLTENGSIWVLPFWHEFHYRVEITTFF